MIDKREETAQVGIQHQRACALKLLRLVQPNSPPLVFWLCRPLRQRRISHSKREWLRDVPCVPQGQYKSANARGFDKPTSGEEACGVEVGASCPDHEVQTLAVAAH